MTNLSFEHFLMAAGGGEPPRVPVALSVDSAYMPGLMGVNTLDYLLYPGLWIEGHLFLAERFPQITFVPSFRLDYGTVAEASGFGPRVLWQHDGPPVVRPLRLHPNRWNTLPHPDPHTDGLMALLLRRLWNLEKEGGLPLPHHVHFANVQGPFAIAAQVLGADSFLAAIAAEPDQTRQVLDVLELTTDLAIRYVQAQLSYLREPVGVVIHDDSAGMLDRRAFERFAAPFLQRIFARCEGLLRIFRCDSASQALLPPLAELDFEVLHYSHRLDSIDAKAALGGRKALMGNLSAPFMAQSTPEQVYAAGREIIARAGQGGGFILSVGGAVNAGTSLEKLDALAQAAQP